MSGRSTVVIDSSEDAVAAAIDRTVTWRFAGMPETTNSCAWQESNGPQGLVAAVAPDPDCLMVVLTARSLAPDLPIVARAEQEVSEPKLRRAGADRVVSLYRIAGRRMAEMAIRPDLAEFVD